MSWRDMGKASFMDIYDRTGRMQVYLKIDQVGEESYNDLKSYWDLGDIISVKAMFLKPAEGKFLFMQKRLSCFPSHCSPCRKNFMD